MPFKLHGQDLNQSAGVKEAQVQLPHRAALFPLWAQAGVYARLRIMPDLLPRVRERGDDTGGEEVFMVIFKYQVSIFKQVRN
jgi:hypothetical protein